jgi:hypothetical protein
VPAAPDRPRARRQARSPAPRRPRRGGARAKQPPAVGRVHVLM